MWLFLFCLFAPLGVIIVVILLRKRAWDKEDMANPIYRSEHERERAMREAEK